MSTVGVNGRTAVHAGSNGMVMAFPDTCLTPTGAGPPVPVPYPNIAQSSDAASTASVAIGGNGVCIKDSTFSRSTGDEAGSSGGVMSGTFGGASHFVSYSFDVKIEGGNVVRALDLATSNDRNTPPFPVIQPPLPGTGVGEESHDTADWKLVRGGHDETDETE